MKSSNAAFSREELLTKVSVHDRQQSIARSFPLLGKYSWAVKIVEKVLRAGGKPEKILAKHAPSAKIIPFPLLKSQPALAKITRAPRKEFLKGRPVISPYTRFTGGIYIHDLQSEALVIDEKYGLLKELSKSVIAQSRFMTGPESEKEIIVFRHVIAKVRSALRLHQQELDNLRKKKALAPCRKVALDVFLNARLGAPRHQALLAGYLLERLIDAGVLHGRPELIKIAGPGGASHEGIEYFAAGDKIFRFDPLSASL